MSGNDIHQDAMFVNGNGLNQDFLSRGSLISADTLQPLLPGLNFSFKSTDLRWPKGSERNRYWFRQLAYL